MISQGVMVGENHVGVVEELLNGRFWAFSTITGMGESFARFDSGVWFLGDSASRCGVAGEVRVPEHLMEVRR